jgi:hypothetical protein
VDAHNDGAVTEALATGFDFELELPEAPIDERIDRLEAQMLVAGEPVELPLTHRFTPGLYAREIFMPAGTLLTSRIHNTEHPYVVLEGRVRVFIDGVGVQELVAGHVGVTKAGTRRVLYIVEDCRWVTFHPLVEGEESEADLAQIEARIIERRELAGGHSAFELYADQLAQKAITAGVLPEQGEYGGAP